MYEFIAPSSLSSEERKFDEVDCYLPLSPWKLEDGSEVLLISVKVLRKRGK